jgi:hypothetical protein
MFLSRPLRWGKQQSPVWLGFLTFMAAGFVAVAPAVDRMGMRQGQRARFERLAQSVVSPTGERLASCGRPAISLPGPRSQRLDGLLSSWQTVGGCGAGASTGSSTGIKWIGRGVSGGLFSLQCQTTYTRLEPYPGRAEHHAVSNTTLLVSLTNRLSFGANLPVIYKFMNDPFETGTDLSNSGIGDVSVMAIGKLGPIGATAVTATVGLPTGQFDGTYKMKILNQSQQRGFGKPTASLMLDHTLDELWGVTVLGAMASWRGGANEVDNYRAPLGSVFGYVGYMLGAFTPAAGLSLSGLTGHDRDQTVTQRTGLYIAAANVSLEWATDSAAFLLGASLPYQYDGIYEDTEGRPRSPWGWGPWVLGLGIALSPF